jgi:hypothetical protein
MEKWVGERVGAGGGEGMEQDVEQSVLGGAEEGSKAGDGTRVGAGDGQGVMVVMEHCGGRDEAEDGARNFTRNRLGIGARDDHKVAHGAGGGAWNGVGCGAKEWIRDWSRN